MLNKPFFNNEEDNKSEHQQRGYSLTRILRRSKIPTEGATPGDKPDEHVRGIFSRIMGQIRGKNLNCNIFHFIYFFIIFLQLLSNQFSSIEETFV